MPYFTSITQLMITMEDLKLSTSSLLFFVYSVLANIKFMPLENENEANKELITYFLENSTPILSTKPSMSETVITRMLAIMHPLQYGHLSQSKQNSYENRVSIEHDIFPIDWQDQVFSARLPARAEILKGVTSKHDCKMSPQDKDTQSNWFPGQKLLGKFMNSTASGLTQAKGLLCQPPFLRLNSQGGESSGSEDDISLFPCVEPIKEDMATPCELPNPMWGMFGHRAAGPRPVPLAPRYGEYTLPGQCPRKVGHYPYRPRVNIQDPYTQPPPFLAWPPQMEQCAYNNPYAVPQMPARFAPRFMPNYQRGVFQFHGCGSNAYRTPIQNRKPHTGSRRVGAHKHSREKPLTQPISSQAANNKVMTKGTQDCKSPGQTMASDITQDMVMLDISSENDGLDGSICAHAESHIGATGPVPATEVSSLVTCEDQQTSSHHSPDDSEDIPPSYINTELSLVADLCHMDINDASQIKIQHNKDDSPSQLAGVHTPSTMDKHDGKKLRMTRIQTACYVLTPKMSCLSNNKKKKRPSSKKRQRRKVQQCGEEAVNTPGYSKKQRTESPDQESCHEPMSFVIDFSESEISESEPQSGNSPKASGSPIAKFSLFIRAGDLSSDDQSTDSDSDFFDDDNSSECDSAAQKIASSPKDWRSAFPDVGCLSPFTFQITCITKPSNSKSNNSGKDEVDSNQPVQDDQSFIDPDAKKRLDDANMKWEENYNKISSTHKSSYSKVQFPDDNSKLQTVFTLSADEDSAYREARLSKWEQYARDRERFNKRIEDTEKVLADCLLPGHRAQIYYKLYGQGS